MDLIRVAIGSGYLNLGLDESCIGPILPAHGMLQLPMLSSKKLSEQRHDESAVFRIWFHDVEA